MGTTGLISPSSIGYNLKTALPWRNLAWASSGGSGLPSNGSLVGQWNDEGTAALHMGASGTARPTMRTAVTALNNKPAVECDGTTDWMISAAGSASAVPYTMVWIGNIRALPGAGIIDCIMPIGTVSAQRGLGINATSTWRLEAGANIQSGGPPTTGPHLIIAFINGTSTTLEVDGTATGSFGNASQTISFNTFGFGARNGTEFAETDNAVLGQVPRALTSPEKAALRAWSQGFYTTP